MSRPRDEMLNREVDRRTSPGKGGWETRPDSVAVVLTATESRPIR